MRLSSESSSQNDAQAICLYEEKPHPAAISKTKRLIDICGALVGLLITSLCFIPIAIAIWLDDPGPVLYRQMRFGLNGRPFRLWKFRSMIVDADRLKHWVPNEAKGQIFKNYNDPRVTRIGKYLRCTSLDEFPQFWNVLRGDMSLVGTRPPTIDEVAQYQPRHFQRLRVKPGMTGEWQVHGRSKIEDFEVVVQMDLLYQQKWSIIYDWILIFKTIGVLLRRDGAY
jgi:lipopolysaccharide/colanic/teichoic acid biosynthesis glycosyltransferase